MKRDLIIGILLGLFSGIILTLLVLRVAPPEVFRDITIVWVIGMMISLYLATHKEWKDKRETHAKLMADAMRKWIDGLKFGQINIGEGTISIQEPEEPRSEYFRFVVEHLKHEKGYYDDFWKFWEEYKKSFENEKTRVTELWNKLRENVIKTITESCPNLSCYERQESKPQKCYYPNRIMRLLLAKTPFNLNEPILNSGDEWLLKWEGNIVAKSNVKEDLTNLPQAIKTLTEDPNCFGIINQIQIKDFGSNKETLSAKMNEIIEDVEMGMKVKGKCSIGY